MKKISLSSILFLTILSFYSHSYADETWKITALAKKPAFLLPDEPAQLDFVFDKSKGIKGWLKQNGELYVEGFINHSQFRCGTYQLGIQFAKGDGCINLEWLSEPVFVSSKRQCNQAALNHRGHQKLPDMVENFEKVTCAQVIIKCRGTCGLGTPEHSKPIMDLPFQ